MHSKEDRITQLTAHFVLLLLTMAALLPFVLLIAASFTDNTVAIAEGYRFSRVNTVRRHIAIF